MEQKRTDQSIGILLDKFPMVSDFLASFNLKLEDDSLTFVEIVTGLPSSFFEDQATDAQQLLELFDEFMIGLNETQIVQSIESLEVLAGIDKSGKPEKCSIKLIPGEITCIVGPTGSGKSRLLADIEWLANKDTPTGRTVLINGDSPDDSRIAQMGGKLIAQITQNMNFVLDMSVIEFLRMHAQSHFMMNVDEVVEEVIKLANDLSGEPFQPETPVTFLSGGQSRALMIADVACIGQAPIVLIDEIENAGVNKKKSLDLLVKKDKIVLMATHDPLLILLADKRVVIKNGGMHKVIETNPVEREFYSELEQLDNKLQLTKDYFRYGNELKAIGEIY
ncbi:ATP-binding cassette domain-containing protein [Carboxylicivirga caseinilyticus]|uniref:ATP-binding cassette domain-containing protein n=1 Tax=Carboxylicivirga caseinilyticus TaxID=3417572 RepID=UPI003D325330|nr:ATP-binding cassette domain-containing protein [Marinilabiliaceae bacterium A049]